MATPITSSSFMFKAFQEPGTPLGRGLPNVHPKRTEITPIGFTNARQKLTNLYNPFAKRYWGIIASRPETHVPIDLTSFFELTPVMARVRLEG